MIRQKPTVTGRLWPISAVRVSIAGGHAAKVTECHDRQLSTRSSRSNVMGTVGRLTLNLPFPRWKFIALGEFASVESGPMEFDSRYRRTVCLDRLDCGKFEDGTRKVAIREINALKIAFSKARSPQARAREICVGEPRMRLEVSTI